MAFILIEHETKPIKLKGNKIVPATISPLRADRLEAGEYIGIESKQKIKLLNFGGFISYTPQAKMTAHLAEDIPATLDENACNAKDGELYVAVESASNVQQVIFSKIITQNWVNSDFWIASLFYHNDILIGEGWFKINGVLNQAVVVNAIAEIEPPIRINAINDLGIVCECMDIYSKEYYEYN